MGDGEDIFVSCNCFVELDGIGFVGDEGIFECEDGGVAVAGGFEEDEPGKEELEVEIAGAHGKAASCTKIVSAASRIGAESYHGHSISQYLGLEMSFQ